MEGPNRVDVGPRRQVDRSQMAEMSDVGGTQYRSRSTAKVVPAVSSTPLSFGRDRVETLYSSPRVKPGTEASSKGGGI
jgi:hypothetical protein